MFLFTLVSVSSPRSGYTKRRDAGTILPGFIKYFTSAYGTVTANNSSVVGHFYMFLKKRDDYDAAPRNTDKNGRRRLRLFVSLMIWIRRFNASLLIFMYGLRRPLQRWKLSVRAEWSSG